MSRGGARPCCPQALPPGGLLLMAHARLHLALSLQAAQPQAPDMPASNGWVPDVGAEAIL